MMKWWVSIPLNCCFNSSIIFIQNLQPKPQEVVFFIDCTMDNAEHKVESETKKKKKKKKLKMKFINIQNKQSHQGQLFHLTKVWFQLPSNISPGHIHMEVFMPKRLFFFPFGLVVEVVEVLALSVDFPLEDKESILSGNLAKVSSAKARFKRFLKLPLYPNTSMYERKQWENKAPLC